MIKDITDYDYSTYHNFINLAVFAFKPILFNFVKIIQSFKDTLTVTVTTFFSFINKKKEKENVINVKFIKSREITVTVIRFYVLHDITQISPYVLYPKFHLFI